MSKLLISVLLFSILIHAQNDSNFSDSLYIYFSEGKDQSKYSYTSASVLQGEMMFYNYYPEGLQKRDKVILFLKTDYLNYEDYQNRKKVEPIYLSKSDLKELSTINFKLMKKVGYEKFRNDFANKKFFVVEAIQGKKDEYIAWEVNFLSAKIPDE